MPDHVHLLVFPRDPDLKIGPVVGGIRKPPIQPSAERLLGPPHAHAALWACHTLPKSGTTGKSRFSLFLFFSRSVSVYLSLFGAWSKLHPSEFGLAAYETGLPSHCANRNAIIITVACVLQLTKDGIADASQTQSPSIPCTLNLESTTPDDAVPIPQVPA